MDGGGESVSFLFGSVASATAQRHYENHGPEENTHYHGNDERRILDTEFDDVHELHARLSHLKFSVCGNGETERVKDG